MKTPKHIFRVLVFPSSNEPGLEIIHALEKSNKVELFAASSVNPTYDPSALLVKHHLTLPFMTDQNFKKELVRLCRKHHIRYIFPTVDAVIAELSGWHLPGITCITSSAKTTNLVFSKKLLYRKLKQSIPVPAVYHTSQKPRLPVFAKPDKGSGARDCKVITTQDALAQAKKMGLLICENLVGEEYTVDALNDRNGNLLFYNPRLRANIGKSISLGTSSAQDPVIDSYMKTITKNIRIAGPWFAQFKRGKDGILKLLEINCRIGGSTTLTRLSGVNIPLLSLWIFAGYPVSVPKPLSNIVVNRYLSNAVAQVNFQTVIWDLNDTIISKRHTVDPEVVGYLYDFKNRGKTQLLFSKTKRVNGLLRRYRIPNFFQTVRYTPNKVSAIVTYLKRHRIKANTCVVVNDSNRENLELQKRLPDIITVTPDAVELLGKEKYT